MSSNLFILLLLGGCFYNFFYTRRTHVHDEESSSDEDDYDNFFKEENSEETHLRRFSDTGPVNFNVFEDVPDATNKSIAEYEKIEPDEICMLRKFFDIKVLNVGIRIFEK